jgi:hypothetical protein
MHASSALSASTNAALQVPHPATPSAPNAPLHPKPATHASSAPTLAAVADAHAFSSITTTEPPMFLTPVPMAAHVLATMPARSAQTHGTNNAAHLANPKDASPHSCLFANSWFLDDDVDDHQQGYMPVTMQPQIAPAFPPLDPSSYPVVHQQVSPWAPPPANPATLMPHASTPMHTHASAPMPMRVSAPNPMHASAPMLMHAPAPMPMPASPHSPHTIDARQPGGLPMMMAYFPAVPIGGMPHGGRIESLSAAIPVRLPPPPQSMMDETHEAPPPSKWPLIILAIACALSGAIVALVLF